MTKIKMRHCFNCGKEIGADAFYEPLDTCGARECEREAQDARAMERQDAHDRLDQDRGW